MWWIARYAAAVGLALAGCGPEVPAPVSGGTGGSSSTTGSPTGADASETGGSDAMSTTDATTAVADSESGEPPPPPEECHTGDPWFMCGDECTNIFSDGVNCGACDRKCKQGPSSAQACWDFVCTPEFWPCLEATAPVATCAAACATVGELCAAPGEADCAGGIELYRALPNNDIDQENKVQACRIDHGGQHRLLGAACTDPIPWDFTSPGSNNIVVAARCCCTQTWSYPD